MTLKRKLGIATALVVVAGFLALLRKPEPDPPLSATFVGYQGSNVVLNITNLTGRKYWALMAHAPQKERFAPRETRQVVVYLGTRASKIDIYCHRIPSVLDRLQVLVGRPLQKPVQITIRLPPP